MTAINKIYLQMLVQLLRRENLICSFRWIFKPDWRSVYSINRFSPEVKGLASKYIFCNSNDRQINWVFTKIDKKGMRLLNRGDASFLIRETQRRVREASLQKTQPTPTRTSDPVVVCCGSSKQGCQ